MPSASIAGLKPCCAARLSHSIDALRSGGIPLPIAYMKPEVELRHRVARFGHGFKSGQFQTVAVLEGRIGSVERQHLCSMNIVKPGQELPAD